MCLPDHRHLLIDFDQIAHGPLEWDLVPSLVAYMRFEMPAEDLDSFIAAYGYDLRKSLHVSSFHLGSLQSSGRNYTLALTVLKASVQRHPPTPLAVGRAPRAGVPPCHRAYYLDGARLKHTSARR